MSSISLTPADFLARVRIIFGNPTASIWTDTIVYNMINQAYWADVCARFDFYGLINTVDATGADGTQTLEFDCSTDTTVGCLAVKAASIPSLQSPLERFSWEDFDRMGGNLTTTAKGTPTHYYRIPDTTDADNLVLGLFPTMDQAYTIRVTYRARPAAIANGEEDVTSVLPVEWDDVIITYAASRLAQSMRLFEESAFLRQQGDDMAMGLVGINLTTTSDYRWDAGGSQRGGR